MSTFVTITVEKNDKYFVEHAFKIFKDIDASLSSFNKKSPIYKLNKNKKAKINNYTYEAFVQSKKFYKDTDAYFNIAIGSITKDLYRFGADERVASRDELKKARVDFNDVFFTKDEAKLAKGIKVDFGGMGKGFGVDYVSSYFRGNSVDATISASGDIRCLGICSFDIQNPFGEGALSSYTTTKKDLGISTSGNYVRYVKSKNNNHLINPKTKKSQTTFVSITLISELSSSALDAYATASSVMPIKKAYEFLDSLELAYIILQSNGDLKISSNISDYALKK
ncbi:FAD:protein FMN transferase [Sulfurimonas sp.]|uniref:FAD:protein FMN transferase n=1 Tax=Sulfurimonas sp. TaxID=2022749 RepID=UPI002AB284EF|nr:FAD:protein FMN transferase [Sulfurimonas sp.]